MSVFRAWFVMTFQDVSRAFRELENVLRRLSFGDNFEGFETTILIPATVEVEILNELSYIPTSYIVLSLTGDGTVRKGSTEWTTTKLYLRNPDGSNDVTAKVRFFR